MGADEKLPESKDGVRCRRCWELEDYDEPDDHFRERIAKLLEFLRGLVLAPGTCRHVAVFAHCWVLEEIWRISFGHTRRFSNCELAVVEVLPDGSFHMC